MLEFMKRVIQDGNTGGSWAPLFPWTQWMYSYAWSDSLWRRSRNKLGDSYTSDDWENAHTETHRKGWGTLLSWNPLSAEHHTIGREPQLPASLWGVKGLNPTSRAPAFKIPIRRADSQNISLWKPVGLVSLGPIRPTQTKKQFLMGAWVLRR